MQRGLLKKKISYITDSLIGRVFFNAQKAELLLLRGNAYAKLAEKLFERVFSRASVVGIDNAGFGTKSGPGRKRKSSIEDRSGKSYNFKSRTEAEVILAISGLSSPLNENCNNYAGLIFDDSKKYNLPDPLLLLSLMIQESSCKKDAYSDTSYGLMQINLLHCGKYGLDSSESTCKNTLINNPQKNIEVGAKILRSEEHTSELQSH